MLVRMLTTATGPTMHLDAGSVYDLPNDLANSLMQKRAVTTEEVIVENGKEKKTERKIGSVGPFAEPAPPGSKVERNWRRNPNPEAEQ